MKRWGRVDGRVEEKGGEGEGEKCHPGALGKWSWIRVNMKGDGVFEERVVTNRTVRSFEGCNIGRSTPPRDAIAD